jgi:hypothetical protein
MGDHELDNSTEESVQANLLPCMAINLIVALHEADNCRNKPQKHTTDQIHPSRTYCRSSSH